MVASAAVTGAILQLQMNRSATVLESTQILHGTHASVSWINQDDKKRCELVVTGLLQK